ncbi:condensation domain-containing protein [Streptomyces sp. NY05-11A]|uniref:condensation domain-containing protein n=1 Tax=Streptomyces soliscabiei TaxID=588897 RepID=UPI0029A6604A|nr:condensation domain-containing protein [Streptomyces sp. NY05-11A]MDX2680508.1 condensation domain-containing protein [Streptomyces sp. NY05-11A]
MQEAGYSVPLAPIQEHFVSAGAGGTAQGECVAVRLSGALDPAVLRQAVLALLRRHEILRANVATAVDGEATLWVRPAPESPPLELLDLADRPTAEGEAALRSALAAFAARELDPSAGSLLRFLLVRLSADEQVLALAVHHLVADATSVRIMWDELSRDCMAAPGASVVPEPALQYGDYAAWEREHLIPAAERTDGPYWRSLLDGAPTALDLRTDRPHPRVKGTTGRRTGFPFAPELAAALRVHATERHTTVYAVGLAAFAALITRSTGAEDLVLGVLSANRTTAQTTGLVGQFANTLPLRLDVSGDPTFDRLTERCARTVAGAMEHGRLPFSHILDLARPERDGSRTPLIQHLFLPLVDAVGASEFAGLPAVAMEVERSRGRFDTIVELEVTEHHAGLWVEYDTALYTPAGIAALAADYERLLTGWLANPDLPASKVELNPPPPSVAPAADLAELLGLAPADTVRVDADFAEAEAVATAARQSRATFSAPSGQAAVAAVRLGPVGRLDTVPGARTVLVDGPLDPREASRLRSAGATRILRLVRPADSRALLAVDLTDLPGTWPTVRCIGARPVPPSGPLAACAPAPLLLDVDGRTEPTELTVRWGPAGELWLIDAPQPVSDPRAPSAADRPADPLVPLVVELWAETMELPEVGPDDDFFTLGGHSMLGARLVANLQESLGIELSLRLLFENPTPALLAEELRHRYPRLADMLRLLDAEDHASPDSEGANTGAAPPRTARRNDVERTVPLLAAQRQLWLAEHLNPGRLTHTIPLLLRIDGPLDTAALRAAVGDVVARQDGLRGTFVEIDGEPMQRILPFRGVDVPVIDLSALPAGDRTARNQALEEETAYGGFDLSVGPLLRSRLVRLGEREHVLHLLFHHLVTDEVSMTVFMRELTVHYRRRTGRHAVALPELELDFADLAASERELLAGREGDRLRRYWQSALTGVPALELPTDHPRPERPGHTGEFLAHPAPRALADAVIALASERRTTPYTVFLTAVLALLHQLSGGQPDLVVGVPTENRVRRGAEHLVGCFLNVVPVRVDCSGDPRFPDLLERVGANLLRAYDHQRLPFPEILEATRAERPTDRHPIYQVTCELQLDGWMPVELPDCRVSYEMLSHGTARYHLSFHGIVRADDFQVMLELDTGLWKAETGRRHLERLTALLTAVTADPTLRLSALYSRVMPSDERYT